jgi:hypothetical protein
LFRIYNEIKGCFIGNFSTAKILLGTHSKEFREHFQAKLEKMFIVPSYTFDNVKGKFPVGFFIWNTQIESPFKNIDASIYEQDGAYIGRKNIFAPPSENIKDWLRKYKTTENPIGYLVRGSSDIQNSNIIFLTLKPSDSVLNASNASLISKDNLMENAIFLTVRKIIAKTWINDRDQFLYPNSKWENDDEFKSDCLAFSLLDQSNNVKSSEGTNHWIPFTAKEVNAKTNFQSTFMSDFLKGKKFSTEAQDVLNSGKELWKYYHQKIKKADETLITASVDASFYDIREFFQGRSEKGTMKQKSDDETYNLLIRTLRQNMAVLAEKIKPKVYKYGFLVG